MRQGHLVGSAGGVLPLRSGQLFGYGAPACNAPREDPMDLIIFDLDGTLIDSGATLLAAQAERAHLKVCTLNRVNLDGS